MAAEAGARPARVRLAGPRVTLRQRLRSGLVRRLSWGVADQAVSSLANAAVGLYIVRTLGATQFGAFSLAYVTFGFALNASRGLSTDPLLIRFSGVEKAAWRRAVASSTGTSILVGLAGGAVLLVVAALLGGTTGTAFLALGLTMPILMLQDSWRFSFFALGRGSQAFLNDLLCAVALFPALVTLQVTGHANVFSFVLAWGGTAGVGALLGPVQAKVLPRMSGAWEWLSGHRDLGPRYLIEGTSGSAALQLRAYGIGLLLGLASIGYVQAAGTLMGPITILFLGMSLVTIPEAARVLRRSPRRLPLFCLLVSAGEAGAAAAWGTVLLLTVPRGLGTFLLGPVWRPAYPLLLPTTLEVIAIGIVGGAGVGLRALGASRRSLPVAVFSAAAFVACALTGAALGGTLGAVWGTVISSWLAVALTWRQLGVAMRESDQVPPTHGFLSTRRPGRHRAPASAPLSRRRRRATAGRGD